MRCAACNRPMLRDGLQIGRLMLGPVCARKAGLVQPKRRPARIIDRDHPQWVDPRQVDWVGGAA